MKHNFLQRQNKSVRMRLHLKVLKLLYYQSQVFLKSFSVYYNHNQLISNLFVIISKKIHCNSTNLFLHQKQTVYLKSQF